MIPADDRFLPVRVDPGVYVGAIREVEAVGRPLRLDPSSTQGVATQWFTRSAFQDQDLPAAHAYIDYERAEFVRIYETVLTGWLSDIVGHVGSAEWGPRHQRLLRVPAEELWPRLYEQSRLAADTLHAAADTLDLHVFDAAQRSLQATHVLANDLCVRWIQDLLTVVAEEEGEEAVERLMRVSYERIWRERYRSWADLTHHERLALSAEGMRAHYPGPGRRGDFEVREEPDRYVMIFDPCGTGGVLRRENLTGQRWFDQDLGSNTQVHPWSFGRTGIPWYCTHCPMLLEYFPMETFGRALRPVVWHDDPMGPTTEWIVFKDATHEALGPGPVTAAAQ